VLDRAVRRQVFCEYFCFLRLSFIPKIAPQSSLSATINGRSNSGLGCTPALEIYQNIEKIVSFGRAHPNTNFIAGAAENICSVVWLLCVPLPSLFCSVHFHLIDFISTIFYHNPLYKTAEIRERGNRPLSRPQLLSLRLRIFCSFC
jgi:hypothetical protein